MTTTQEGQAYLEIAIADGLVKFTGEGRNQRIHYAAADHSERWSDPEEKVRAELWAELIYKYQYPPERIGFEVNVPRRTPNDYADLVIYRDDELKDPWFVFECKRGDIWDAAFNQSIEQACGNRASLGARFCGAVAGLTRRLLRFDKFPPGERDKNHLTDIPIGYGDPPAWRFYKNQQGQDLAAVPREELRKAIRTFGAVIKRTEKGDGYLEQYDLRRYLNKNNYPGMDITGEDVPAGARSGGRAIRERASVKTEILFLERIHSFLKPGSGRAAVVLPDGILTNSSLEGVRRWILQHFQLLAVVSLPQFAFAHYDAGVKASIVFLRRLYDGEVVPDDAPIFMAMADNIGYDATGRSTFSETVEEKIPFKEKVEIHSCDLYDQRVFYEWSAEELDWSERRREVIADTGLLGQWSAFKRDPTPFFA